MNEKHDNTELTSWFHTTSGLFLILGCLAIYLSISSPPEDESFLKLLYVFAGVLHLILTKRIWGRKGAVSFGLIGLIYLVLGLAFILFGPLALLILFKIFIISYVYFAFVLISMLRIWIGIQYKSESEWLILSVCGLLTIVNINIFIFYFHDNQLLRMMASIELLINAIFLYYMTKVIRS